MNKMLQAELKHEKEAYGGWKQAQVTEEEYRDNVSVCQDEVGKARAQLELYLARDVKDQKGFFEYIGDERKARENASSRCMRWWTWLHRMWKRLRY